MSDKSKFLIGTSGWMYKDWRGEFYPEDLPLKEWFSHYKKHFNIVELNATFYRRFSKKVYKKWREQAKDYFQYVVKVSRYVTHRKLLKNCTKEIKQFCKAVSQLESSLALILLQLPPRMPYDIERLRKALLAFDDPKKVIVEFRDKRWLTEETKQLLTEVGAIFCIIDSPEMPLTPWITSDIIYIRMHGRKRWYNYNYTINELNELAIFAKSLRKKGAKQIYILFNNDYFSYGADNALYLNRILK